MVSINPTSKQSKFNNCREKDESNIMDKWEFYKDAKGEWRWRRKAPNGETVGASTEGYKNREDCVANAKRNGYRGS
jgi:uncharacterized protein YegP (UPF0339 family)